MTSCGNARAVCGVVLLGTIGLWLVACTAREAPTPTALAPPITRVESPPEWRPGDRWVYDWTSRNQTGTKTVEVLEIKEVNQVPYYVVRIGDVDHYFTLDFKWSGSVRKGRVEARMVPPQPWLIWPLEVGERWAHRGIYEQRKKKDLQNDTFAVVTSETIGVPAGRFQAFKVVRESPGRDSDQYWYAPQVRWYVKWIGRRGEVEYEERLREYRAAPPPPRESAPSSPPSKTK